MFLDQFDLATRANEYKFTWSFTDQESYVCLGIFTEDTVSATALRDVCGLLAKCDLVGDTSREPKYSTGSILGARVERVSRVTSESTTESYLGIFTRKDLPFWVTSIIYGVFGSIRRMFSYEANSAMMILEPGKFDIWLSKEPTTLDFIDDVILIGIHRDELGSGTELFKQQPFSWEINLPDSLLVPCSFVNVDPETAVIQPSGTLGLLLPSSFEIPIADLRQLVMDKNAIIGFSTRMSKWLTEKV